MAVRLQQMINDGILTVNAADGRVLTESDTKHIQDKLGWLIKDWRNILFQHVWEQGIKAGVKHFYWNTPENVKGELGEGAKDIAYKTTPKKLGFEKEPYPGVSGNYLWGRNAFNLKKWKK